MAVLQSMHYHQYRGSTQARRRVIMLRLTVNGQTHALDIDPDTPLLWVLRDHLKLPGTKYGCGIGLCGSCTVHINDRARRNHVGIVNNGCRSTSAITSN